jgi:hypothetical protein
MARTYSLVPITVAEKDQFRSERPEKKRKESAAKIFKTPRPMASETNFFLFIIREMIASTEVFFSFVIQFLPLPSENRIGVNVLSAFAFINDGTKMFVSFHQNIKNKKRFSMPETQGNRLFHRSLSDKYNDLYNLISGMIQSPSQSKLTPIQAQQNKRILTIYVNDVNKDIEKNHSYLKDEIHDARKKLLVQYISKPSLSLERISRKNRSIIQQIRKQHEEQLLKIYGTSDKQLPRQMDQYYRERIIKWRKEQKQKKEQEQQMKMKPFQQMIQQSIRSYGDEPEMLVEDVVWKQLGLLDPVTHQRIIKPVILPSSKTVIEKSTIQTIQKDPISRVSLPQDKDQLPVNRFISQTIQSVNKKIEDIMGSDLPLRVKVFKMIQLREKTRKDMDKQRLKK